MVLEPGKFSVLLLCRRKPGSPQVALCPGKAEASA